MTNKSSPARPKANKVRGVPSRATPSNFVPKITSAETLAEHLERLPQAPGVYIMRDREGAMLYVGKARVLRQRVRQYFSGHDTRSFVPHLAAKVGDIETIVTANDKEALLLENNLIKSERPRYNVKLRDDKQYLVLRLDPRAAWPKLDVVRNIRNDRAYYFGPYHSAQRARATLRVVNRHFQLRTCSDYVLNRRKRPCLEYHIDRCPAPCVLEVDPKHYAAQVSQVKMFLEGRHRELRDDLASRMHKASEDLEFERAARLRDQLQAIGSSLDRQRVVASDWVDQDIVGFFREGGQVEFVMMQVREGKVLGSRAFSERGMELPDPEVLHGFLRAYYESSSNLPDEILLPSPLFDDDRDPLEQQLSERRDKRCTIRVPQRGDKKKLITLAQKNAASNFASRRNRHRDAEKLLEHVMQRLRLSRTPRRIECYDISHIQGSDVVASMVVFIDGVADKKKYRSFKIRGQGDKEGRIGQNDDFASMYEVVSRRIRRALEDQSEDWSLPDLMVIDGGKGQLGSALAAMKDLGISTGSEGFDVLGLAKQRNEREDKPGKSLPAAPSRPERVFLPGSKDPLRLRQGSSEHFLMTQIRDEAHRFAITHHRKRRGKRALRSDLDEISGVGPKLKKALLSHFKTFAALREADENSLLQVPGVGPAMAKRLREALG